MEFRLVCYEPKVARCASPRNLQMGENYVTEKVREREGERGRQTDRQRKRDRKKGGGRAKWVLPKVSTTTTKISEKPATDEEQE